MITPKPPIPTGPRSSISQRRRASNDDRDRRSRSRVVGAGLARAGLLSSSSSSSASAPVAEAVNKIKDEIKKELLMQPDGNGNGIANAKGGGSVCQYEYNPPATCVRPRPSKRVKVEDDSVF